MYALLYLLSPPPSRRPKKITFWIRSSSRQSICCCLDNTSQCSGTVLKRFYSFSGCLSIQLAASSIPVRLYRMSFKLSRPFIWLFRLCVSEYLKSLFSCLLWQLGYLHCPFKLVYYILFFYVGCVCYSQGGMSLCLNSLTSRLDHCLNYLTAHTVRLCFERIIV